MPNDRGRLATRHQAPNWGVGGWVEAAAVNGLKRLEAEYRGADETLLRLVAVEIRRAALRTSMASDTTTDRSALVTGAVDDGFRRVIRWQAGQRSPLGLVARQAVAEAVAADVLRSRLPQE